MGLQSINRKLSEHDAAIRALKIAPSKKGEPGESIVGPPGEPGKSVHLKDVVAAIMPSVMSRIGNQSHGGGNANRNIAVDSNPSVLSRYTDINLKAGPNVTITYTNNDTTKYTDITLESAGGAGTVATGAEVDTGTNNTKFISPLAIEDSSYIKAAYADAKVADVITDGVTTIAPSENAVFDALALKAPLASPTFTGTVTIPTPFTLGAVSVLPTGTELNFVDGVTSAIQTQIDTKAPLASPSFTGTVTLPDTNLNGQLVYSSEFDNGNSGTAITINWATNGNFQKVTRTGNCTYTLTAPTGPATLVLRMVHEASATVYSVTFSPALLYPAGTDPTYTDTSGAIDIVTFYYDGTSYYAVQQAAFAT